MNYDSDDTPVANPHRQTRGGWAPLANQLIGDDIPSVEQPPGYPSCAGADPETFFPEPGQGRWLVPVAKNICRNCPVIEWCSSTHIMEHHGVWGGMSERERRLERLRRGIETLDLGHGAVTVA